jgi:hypothetical protein
MGNSDKQVIVIISLIIVAYILTWITGVLKHQVAYYFSFLNAATALGLIVYWVQKQLSITQHFFEGREIAVLCLEGLVAGIAVYCILTRPGMQWVKVIQYIAFGLHFTVLVLFLVFMLTFKMNKLF